MGGYGSGRTGNKQKAEHCRSLDVNKMRREGCLESGWSGNWVWSRNGQEVARISGRAEHCRIILNYSVRQNGSDWEPITQTVNTTQSDCNYGGQRTYFLCPGVVNGRNCGRRVGKLFSGGRYFLCRHCYQIAYSSQSEARYDRMLRRANKLRMALGGEPGTAHWIAQKPKGMWQHTYKRKRFEIEWCEGQANHLFIAKFAHLLSAEEREMYFG
ncbi:MAG: hypothetical protein V7695_07005 [Sulfitobacter sp.]